MSLTKRILLSVGLGVGLLLVGAVFFRKPLLRAIVSKYLAAHGIRAEFTAEEVSWSRIAFSTIRIEGSSISKLVIERSSKSQAPLGISRIVLRAERLDLKPLIDLVSKNAHSQEPNPKSLEKNGAADPLDLKRLCRTVLPVEWNAEVEQFSWGEDEFPVKASFTHPIENPNLRFALSGKGSHPNSATKMAFSEIKSIRRFDFDIRASFVCGSDRVEALLEALKIEIDSLESFSVSLKNALIRGDGKEFRVDLTNPGELKPTRPLGLSLRFETQAGEIAEANASIDLAKKKLDLRGLKLKALPWVDIREWSLSGRYELSGEERALTLDLKDKKGAVRFNGVQWRSTPDGMSFVIPDRNPSVITLGRDLIGYFPKLSDWFERAEGTLTITGRLAQVGASGSEKEWRGPLRVLGKTIGLKTGYGSISDGEIDFTAASIWPLRSPPGQKIAAKEVSVGRAIHDLEWRFEITSKDLIRFESMEATYAGSEWKVSPFDVEPAKPAVRGFRAQIKSFPLEELLKLALKENVQADGKLSGEIGFDYENGAPSLNGGLLTDAPGWVRYRPGGKPSSLIRFSDGPMEILNAYLYDFHFESMGIELKTDPKYNLLTRLNAMGKNPGYLRQKPLKLGLGVEQNLLSTIRSLMLTYDLPEKMKEHFEKLEAR
jgi:hypothetical protein